MQLALLEAAALLAAADREPELEQVHAVAHQLTFELRGLTQELVTLQDRERSELARDLGRTPAPVFLPGEVVPDYKPG